MKSVTKCVSFCLALAFSAPAWAWSNPFEQFAGTYTVVGPVEVTNWNFPSCTMWELPKAKMIRIQHAAGDATVYHLSVEGTGGVTGAEFLGDFYCGAGCRHETDSKENPPEASASYIPNGVDSPYSRGVIVDSAPQGISLFVADVRYALDQPGHPRNAYCFYKLQLKAK